MGKRLFLPFLVLMSLAVRLSAQMVVEGDTLYGNEWIRYDRTYLRFGVASDEVFAIDYGFLLQQGLPMEEIQGHQWRLFAYGKEVPLYVPGAGPMAPGDRLLFYGEKNRYQLDRHFYPNEEDILNPEYSLISDTAWYFLTWYEESEGPGLRVTAAVNAPHDSLPELPYYWTETTLSWASNHHMTNVNNVQQSAINRGQGFAGALSQQQDITVDLPGFWDVGDNRVRMDAHIIGSISPHDLEVRWNGQVMYRDSFFGFEMRRLRWEAAFYPPPTSGILRVQGLKGSTDRYGVAMVKARYWHNRSIPYPNTRLKVEFPPTDTATRLVLFDGLLSERYMLFIPAMRLFMEAKWEANLVQFALPPMPDTMQAMLLSTLVLRMPVFGGTVNFEPPLNGPADYLILTHSALMEGENMGEIGRYAAYRSSEKGGNYSVGVVDVQKLYDQFSYGIPRHPMAIRNFIHYLEHDGRAPKHIFILGRGRQYHQTRTASQLAHANNRTFFVPTWGTPGSDVLLVTRPGTTVPTCAIGRFPAENTGELRVYLDKIIRYEESLGLKGEEDRAWKQRIIHIGGGANATEQALLRQRLLDLQEIATQGLIGADIQSFYKASTDPIQSSSPAELRALINEGVGLITYFGHSSGFAWEYTVDPPESYTNLGRFPVVLSLGCFTSQVHQELKVYGENFILPENQGAIAWMAATGLADLTPLYLLSDAFYTYIGGEGYAGTIGEALRQSKGSFELGSSFGRAALWQNFTLLGDPAIRIHSAAGPDYRVGREGVVVLPEGIAATDDSFQVAITVENIGRNQGDTLPVEVIHWLPDGREASRVMSAVIMDKGRVTASLALPVPGEEAGGVNRITVRLDPEGILEESPQPEALGNNAYVHSDGQPGLPFDILGSTAWPAWPMDCGIVPAWPPQLRAFTANMLAPALEYLLELDTLASFDSPFRLDTILISQGGVLRWQPSVEGRENTTYYWRVRPAGEIPFWRTRSFTYLPGSPDGWHQQHVGQWVLNGDEDLTIDPETGKFQFASNVRTVRLKNKVFPGNGLIGLEFDHTPQYFYNFGSPVNRGLIVFVIDPVSLEPWSNPNPGRFGSHQPLLWNPAPAYFPMWTNTPERRKQLMDLLQDSIPSGHYVAIYSIQLSNTTYHPEDWAQDSLQFGTNLFQVLEAQGARRIRETESTGATPYVFMYRKDSPDWTAIEALASLDGSIEETVYMEGNWFEGRMVAPQIGPASKWLAFQAGFLEQEPEDEWYFGVHSAGHQVASDVLDEIRDTLSALDWLDPVSHPSLDLSIFASDNTYRTPPQLKYWQVLFDGYPDLSLDPALSWTPPADTVYQGEPVSVAVAVRNLQPSPAWEYPIRFLVTDTGGRRDSLVDALSIPVADSVRIVEWVWQHSQAVGRQSLQIEINPQRQKPETDYRNNRLAVTFEVIPDRQNPVLDVTFDGVRIASGELVSARPEIDVVLSDDNPWLRLRDTALLSLFLRHPSQSVPVTVWHTDPTMQFIPADPASGLPNRAVLHYRPDLEEDGLYTLVVQSRDVAGNAPVRDYQVDFRVALRQQLSSWQPLQNPVSGQLAFSYVMSGSEIITDYRLQIYDMQGRRMASLGAAFLGPLQPGQHVTAQWDISQWASGTYLWSLQRGDGSAWFDGKLSVQ